MFDTPGAGTVPKTPARTHEPALAAQRIDLLRRVLAAFLLGLLGVTWRLWTPQEVFPSVPFASLLNRLGSGGQWAAAAVLLAGLCATLVARRERIWRGALVVSAAALTVLVACDQQRLQPWAWQFILAMLLIANCPAASALSGLRWLTISIYFYSGLSKLDYSFLHGLGQTLVSEGLRPIGIEFSHWPAGARLVAAAVLPLVEWGVALGLKWRSTRGAALVASVIMHSVLLLLLSPLMLGHSSGVLVWNAYFIVQNVLLFGSRGIQLRPVASNELFVTEAIVPVARPFLTRGCEILAQLLLLAALLLPATEPWGWFDAWPSWALYAPGNQRVAVFIRRDAAQRHSELAPLLEESSDAEWLRLRMDRWSLTALGAPIYPQKRFQLAAADAVGQRYELGDAIQVIAQGRASRFSGKRVETRLAGCQQIEQALGAFWFGGAPAPGFLHRN